MTYIRTLEFRKQMSELRKGKPLILTEAQHKNRSENRKGKLNPNWGKVGAMRGKKHTLEARKKMSIVIKAKNSQPEFTLKRSLAVKAIKNPNWKGEQVKYAGLHRWLSKNYGKAVYCENILCLKLSNKFQWAKLRGKEYTRDKNNYAKLCVKCHMNYDRNKNYNICLIQS